MTTRHSTPSETAPTREEADRDAQILRHAKLVRSIARRYTGRGLAYDDIVQSGYIGLIQAVDRFDPSRGVPLRAYAARTIEGEIMHLFRDRGWALRVPFAQEMSRRMAALSERLSHRLGRTPTPRSSPRRRARTSSGHRGSVGAARYTVEPLSEGPVSMTVSARARRVAS
jgi:RNA polymerase sigma-B factor